MVEQDKKTPLIKKNSLVNTQLTNVHGQTKSKFDLPSVISKFAPKKK